MQIPVLSEAGYPDTLFSDKLAYLKIVRQGISGSLVKRALDTMPNQRMVFCRALGTTSNNLSRFYGRKPLSSQHSEEVLDVLWVYSMAYSLYEDLATAVELLNTPLPALNNEKATDLLDTFLGRKMVKDVLNKMQWGEFT
mgnify:FL=1